MLEIGGRITFGAVRPAPGRRPAGPSCLVWLTLTAAALACGFLPRASETADPKEPSPSTTRALVTMPTPPYQPTRTPVSLPEGARHLDAIPFGYHFLTPPEDFPKGKLLVYLDTEKSQINYLTWQGETGPLLRIDRSFWPTAESAPPLAPDELWLMPVGGDGRHIVLDLEMPLSKMNERIYVIFDLIQRQAWAFSASCEADNYLLGDEVGPGFSDLPMLRQCRAFDQCRPLRLQFNIVYRSRSRPTRSLPVPDSLARHRRASSRRWWRYLLLYRPTTLAGSLPPDALCPCGP